MKKSYVFLTVFFALSGMVSAQRQLGIRGGEFCNLSLRTFVNPAVAIEVALTDRHNGFHIAMLQEKFRPLDFPWEGDFVFYSGWGGHAGFASSRKYYHWSDETRTYRWGPLAGADLTAGVEYRFQKIPLSAGLEYNPFAEFSVADFFYINVWNFGLTVRYAIN